MVWTASVIESKLYSEHHDLLFSYFGVSLSAEKRNRIATVQRNIRLKHRMKDDLLKTTRDVSETIKRPYKKFSYSELLIRSIDDRFYPEIDEDSFGISSWFKVEPYDFYHNGIEVVIGVEECIFNDNGNWDLVGRNDTTMREKYRCKHVYVVGRIPYENIVDYDMDGDNHYGFPHVFCDFKNNGMPYEEIVYYVISNEKDQGYTYDHMLDNKLRIALA